MQSHFTVIVLGELLHILLIVKSLVIQSLSSFCFFLFNFVFFLKLIFFKISNLFFSISFGLSLHFLNLFVSHLRLKWVYTVLLEIRNFIIFLCLSFSHHLLIEMTSVLFPINSLFQLFHFRVQYLLLMHLLSVREVFVKVCKEFFIVLLFFNHFPLIFITTSQVS